MAPTVNQQQPFPAVPPSLSAGDHETRDYYAQQDASRPPADQTSYLKPYLGLRARLSQIWINRWTVLLILVLIRLLFAIAGIHSSLSSARREAISACTQVEGIGSSMASMPHYMAKGVNEMTATGIEKAVNGLMTMLDLSVTGVEEIIIFVIHMMTSTYLCLITLAVSGSLHAAVEIGNTIVKGLNETIDSVTNSMGDAVKTVSDGINKVVDKINFPFPKGVIPTINLDEEIRKLKSLEVPPELQKGLQDLNNSIPTFEDVQGFTDNIIRTPFEEVKKLIAGMGDFQFDRQLLPIPQKEKLNFCSEGNPINNFFDDLVEIGVAARKVALGVLIVLAVLVCIPMAYAEIRRYRRMQERAALFHKGHEPMDVVYLASRPHSSAWGLWLGRRFGSRRRQNAVRWFFAYSTSVPMLLLISLGLAGLFSCFCQWIILRSIQKKVPELTDQVADFAEKVIVSLNNASMSWSTGVNGAVDSLDNKINNDILGWVGTTTTAVNDTLNSFVDKMSTTLDKTFGGTILNDPIKEVLNCLIGLKIAGFQKGLTWVKEHAHVSFPGVNSNAFSLGALAQTSGAGGAAELFANPNEKAKDEVTDVINHLVESVYSGIRSEALISLCLILLWLIIMIGGLIYTTTHLTRADEEAGTTDYVHDPDEHDAEQPPMRSNPANDLPPQYEYPANKAAPYTLQTRRFPTFESNQPPQTETVRHVDAHPVAESARPGHARASSHGRLANPSPLDEKSNPFADSPLHDEKGNPFI